jgi:uncharacterized caspase-like protein
MKGGNAAGKHLEVPMRCRFRILKLCALLFVMLALAAAPKAASAQDARCGAGRDLIVQALEHAGPQSGPSDFEDALQLLKRASAVCGELGDAWYYRSLVEARLGHSALAKFAADQAHLLGSEAQNQGLQPFILATPSRSSERGFTVTRAPDAQPESDEPPVAKTPSTAGPVQQKWALVIGIGHFADSAVPKLNYTTADAQAFASLLTDPMVGRFPKANVHTLTDSEATTRNIREQLNWIARHAGPDDIVVIYMATHGSPRKTDSIGGLNYLITYDTEIRSLAQPDEDALYSTALPMIDLSSAVATRMRALRTLVVLDTCYSGGSVKNASRLMGPGLANAAPSPETLQRMSQGSGRIVLAASRVDQESLESETLQHGYFTYFLLKTLRDSKGLQPLSQVYATVQQQVSDRVAAENRSGSFRQNPVMERSSDNADFALGLPIANSANATQSSIQGSLKSSEQENQSAGRF